MRKYVMMGVQGSGKGTQSEMLCADLDMVHISVGDMFRWHVQNHTKLGALVRRTMHAGRLVDDDLVQSTVRDRLDQHDWNFGFVVDGFPRNAAQAEFFMENYDIDAVIVLDIPDDEVRRRVLSRRLCPNCGMDYNLIADRPKVEGRCDICGHELITRADDTPEALAARLHDYQEQTTPVLDLFRRKELVHVVDARPDPNEVQATIRKVLALPSESVTPVA
jgi:adenylate kinase